MVEVARAGNLLHLASPDAPVPCGARTRAPNIVHQRHLCASGLSPHCADRERVAVLEAFFSWAEPAGSVTSGGWLNTLSGRLQMGCLLRSAACLGRSNVADTF